MEEPLKLDVMYGCKVLRPAMVATFYSEPPRPLTFAEKARPYLWGAACLFGGVVGCVAVAILLYLLHAPPSMGVLLGLLVGFLAFNVWDSRR